MQSTNIPSKIPLPFAYAAGGSYIGTIPSASQIGITAGAASLHDGFPPVCFLPIGSGGTPFWGKDVNGILNEITAIQQWQEAGGFFAYDSTFSTTIGGYPKGAILQSTSFNGFWTSTAENNTTNPDTGGAGWAATAFEGLETISTAGGTTTLTNLQAAYPIISITGALTSNAIITMPNIVGSWIIANNTTGGYTLNVKTAAGTGIAISQTTAMMCYGDAINIYFADSGYATTSFVLSNLVAVIGESRNLIGSAAGGTKTASWTADQLIAYTSLTGSPIRGSSLSLSFNGATTGANGMDTGSMPTSNNLYIYAIYNPTTLTWATLGTTAGSGASIYGGVNMPTNYTYSALIWSGVTDSSSNIIGFQQLDRKIAIVQTQVATNFSTTTWTQISLSAAIPFNARTVAGSISSAGSGQVFGMASTGTSGTGVQIGQFIPSIGGSTAEATYPEIVISTAQKISCYASGGQGTNIFISYYTI